MLNLILKFFLYVVTMNNYILAVTTHPLNLKQRIFPSNQCSILLFNGLQNNCLTMGINQIKNVQYFPGRLCMTQKVSLPCISKNYML